MISTVCESHNSYENTIWEARVCWGKSQKLVKTHSVTLEFFKWKIREKKREMRMR